MVRVLWSGSGSGIKRFSEGIMEAGIETQTQVQVMVFGHRLKESCTPGG